jgi:azurin
MKTNLRMLLLAIVLGVALLLTACGGGGGGGTSGNNADGGAGAATIELGVDGENLAFDQTTLSATAGQEVTLNFTNDSAVQQHNWVLVRGGEDVAQPIADEGLTAGLDNDYLPADRSNIIAFTDVVDGGGSDSVTFTAPEAGTYLYICTVPGHYPLMQGTMTVN